MADTTMGQRIAERRKKLGLSQEALGEKMGVSRQAISKWEADGAVPEIDKLIALSRLFSVSVGWLLGVEEEPASGSGGLSEEQIKMVEEIVRRYQPPAPQAQPQPKETLSRRQAVVLCVAILAMLLMVTALAEAFRPDIPDYQSQLANLTSNYSNLQSDIGYLARQLEELTAGEKLLAEYDFSVTALEDLSGAKVTFSALPNTTEANDQAYLSVRLYGEEVACRMCDRDGSGYRAEVELPAADDYSYYFLVVHQGGGTSQQPLEVDDHYVSHIAEGLRFGCDLEFEWQQDGTRWLEINGYFADITVPQLLWEEEDLAWARADLVLYYNDREVMRHDILTAKEAAEPLAPNEAAAVPEHVIVQANPEMEYYLNREFVLLDFRQDGLKPGDMVEARVELVLNSGASYEETVQTWEIR